MRRDAWHPTTLGDVAFRIHYGDGGRPESVEVLYADPRVLISGELLRALAAGKPHEGVPFAAVDRAEVGGILKVAATNRTLVYRITEREPVIRGHRHRDTFVGEFPD